MEQIVVGVAECRIANRRGQTLVTYALGSCIALALHDPAAQVGGLLHFMLPDSSIDPERGRRNPSMFADLGIPALLDSLLKRGAATQRIVADAAGGAQMIGGSGMFDVGRRNYEALQKQLSAARIVLRRQAIGGAVSRNLRLEVGAGRIWLWEGGMRPYGGESKNSNFDRG